MVRKVGGFTFQELNLTIDDIRDIGEAGADLSYDFVNRPAYHHALATADTEFLRLTLRTALELGVDPASLVHALQNHDELTYELVHWSTRPPRRRLHLQAAKRSPARELGDVRARRPHRAAHRRARALQPGLHHQRHRLHHSHRHRRNARHHRPDTIDRADIDRIRTAHLLLAMFNALQPGVFALSGWDLCGMLTLPAARSADLLRERRHPLDPPRRPRPHGRQPARDQVDRPECREGEAFTARSPNSSRTTPASRASCRPSLRVRSHYGIATSQQIDIPDVSHRGMLVMVHQLDDPDQFQLTVLNFANEHIAGTVRSKKLPPGARVSDMFTGEEVGVVDDLNSFAMELVPHHGASLLVEQPPDSEA